MLERQSAEKAKCCGRKKATKLAKGISSCAAVALAWSCSARGATTFIGGAAGTGLPEHMGPRHGGHAGFSPSLEREWQQPDLTGRDDDGVEGADDDGDDCSVVTVT